MRLTEARQRQHLTESVIRGRPDLSQSPILCSSHRSGSSARCLHLRCRSVESSQQLRQCMHHQAQIYASIPSLAVQYRANQGPAIAVHSHPRCTSTIASMHSRFCQLCDGRLRRSHYDASTAHITRPARLAATRCLRGPSSRRSKAEKLSTTLNHCCGSRRVSSSESYGP